jgi:hypothetical protein
MTECPFADLTLSRRLERAEALANARIVEARARLFPDSGSTWIEVAGARAMYDGASAPSTQTFGLGLSQPATDADLDAIEAFYTERGAPVFSRGEPARRCRPAGPSGAARLPPLRVHQRAVPAN